MWRTLQKRRSKFFQRRDGDFSRKSHHHMIIHVGFHIERQVAETSEANSENSLFRCCRVAPKTGRVHILESVIGKKTHF